MIVCSQDTLIHSFSSNHSMGDVGESEGTTEVTATGAVMGGSSHGISAGGELPIIQAAYRLSGKNYLKWSQLIKTFLKGKGKLSHLEGTGPQKEDPTYAAWDEEDSLVMSWLWSAMNPEISDTIMFLTTAKEIWDAMRTTYSKINDAA